MHGSFLDQMQRGNMSAVLKEHWKDILVGRIRAIQAAHLKAHQALVNWGDWCADKRGIFPSLKPPSLWNQVKHSELDEYGEEQAPAVSIVQPEVKPELREMAPYDERTALVIDERIHGYGGLGEYQRHALRAAYVSREIPEDQFPGACGCNADAYCERLEDGLAFVGRFV